VVLRFAGDFRKAEIVALLAYVGWRFQHVEFDLRIAAHPAGRVDRAHHVRGIPEDRALAAVNVGERATNMEVRWLDWQAS